MQSTEFYDDQIQAELNACAELTYVSWLKKETEKEMADKHGVWLAE